MNFVRKQTVGPRRCVWGVCPYRMILTVLCFEKNGFWCFEIQKSVFEIAKYCFTGHFPIVKHNRNHPITESWLEGVETCCIVTRVMLWVCSTWGKMCSSTWQLFRKLDFVTHSTFSRVLVSEKRILETNIGFSHSWEQFESICMIHNLKHTHTHPKFSCEQNPWNRNGSRARKPSKSDRFASKSRSKGCFYKGNPLCRWM
jgi:hypothetical protein